MVTAPSRRRADFVSQSKLHHASQYNLTTVIGFEFFRTVKKRRFWIATLSIPVVMAIIFALLFVSNQSTSASSDEQKNAKLSFTYTDASGLVADDLAAAMGGKKTSDGAAAIAEVKSGASVAYFAYPADPVAESVRVYGPDQGIFENGKYSAVAKQLLITAVGQQIDSPQLTALAQGNIAVDAETYKNGKISGDIGTVVPPLLFLLIFYVSIILLANQMLSSTLEEKENRVTEMILTTLNPTTLIIGKVISVFLVGLVQMLAFALPVVIAYLFFRSELNLPDFDLSHLTFEAGPMAVGLLLLLGGFTLFTGTLVAIGAVVPTVKDAGAIFGSLMALIFVPFYAVSLVVSDPSSFIVQVFTYFPFSAPVTAMLRNGFGSLSTLEASIVIAELFILGFAALRVAVHLFRYGSISYSSRLSIRNSFRRRDPAGAAPAFPTVAP